MKIDHVVQLEATIDDMNPQWMGYLFEVIFDAGALDMWVTQCWMKKNRPGWVVTILGQPVDRDRLAELLMMHTTTIGVRLMDVSRLVMDRQISVRETPLGPVRCKVTTINGVERIRPEYDDVRAIACQHKLTISDVMDRIQEAEKW